MTARNCAMFAVATFALTAGFSFARADDPYQLESFRAAAARQHEQHRDALAAQVDEASANGDFVRAIGLLRDLRQETGFVPTRPSLFDGSALTVGRVGYSGKVRVLKVMGEGIALLLVGQEAHKPVALVRGLSDSTALCDDCEFDLGVMQIVGTEAAEKILADPKNATSSGKVQYTDVIDIIGSEKSIVILEPSSETQRESGRYWAAYRNREKREIDAIEHGVFARMFKFEVKSNEKTCRVSVRNLTGFVIQTLTLSLGPAGMPNEEMILNQIQPGKKKSKTIRWGTTEPIPNIRVSGLELADYVCEQCHGTHMMKCPSCIGVGKETCRVCKGVGKVPDDDEIRGYTVNTPTRRYVDCPNCGGRQKVKCHLCDGAGKIECNKCHAAIRAATVREWYQ